MEGRKRQVFKDGLISAARYKTKFILHQTLMKNNENLILNITFIYK